MIEKIVHRIAHLFGWNTGIVETFYEGNKLMVGFRCRCGKLQDIQEIHEAIFRKG